MPIDSTTFLEAFPEFTHLGVEKVERTLDRVILVQGYTGISEGPKRDMALMLHAAHLLQLNQQMTARGGNVQSIEVEGQGSVTFASARGSEFEQTSYGLELNQLILGLGLIGGAV